MKIDEQSQKKKSGPSLPVATPPPKRPANRPLGGGAISESGKILKMGPKNVFFFGGVTADPARLRRAFGAPAARLRRAEASFSRPVARFFPDPCVLIKSER